MYCRSKYSIVAEKKRRTFFTISLLFDISLAGGKIILQKKKCCIKFNYNSKAVKIELFNYNFPVARFFFSFFYSDLCILLG